MHAKRVCHAGGIKSAFFTLKLHYDQIMAASPSSSSSKLRKSVLSPKYKKEQKSTALATPRINSYSAVVAIDFGTTYSGYAYAFTSDPANVFVMDPRVQGINTAYSAQQPTVLLLTGDESFHSFGYEAQEYYRDIDESESSEMLYFEKFKMELHSIEVSSFLQWSDV